MKTCEEIASDVFVRRREYRAAQKRRRAVILSAGGAAAACLAAVLLIRLPGNVQTEPKNPIDLLPSEPAAPVPEPTPSPNPSAEPTPPAPGSFGPAEAAPKLSVDETVLPSDMPDVEISAAPLAPYHAILTQEEALADAEFGKYFPTQGPEGFESEPIGRSTDSLGGTWVRGMDELIWKVGHVDEYTAGHIVSVSEPEKYDLSLYPKPRGLYMEWALFDVVEHPVFRAKELTLEAVRARAEKSGEAGDSDGVRMNFSVLFGDSTVVQIYGKGVSPEWVYEQLSRMAENP